jgi:hypothetical protein
MTKTGNKSQDRELHHEADVEGRELSERELTKVAGGEAHPGTAGDGNGRTYLLSLMR